ncbi:MAG: TIGR00730 family Rossman fold protein [Patescibacteria group bacterium]
MPKKSSSKSLKLRKKTTTETSEAGSKRLVNWLCAPGNVCLPITEEPAFTESPQWRVFRIMAEFIEGYEFLAKLKGEVSIFGSARAMPNDPYYKAARELGDRLAKMGHTVVTGGGPGIMEAGNRGAFEGGGDSVGLNIQLPIEQRTNKWVKHGMGFHYFFTRKVMLSAASQAYVFFPGGFGTLDEMSEMVTLVQTGKIPSNVPIILFGKAFWQPFLDWVNATVSREHRYIEKEEVAIIQLVDSVEEAIKIIKKTKERPYG